MMSDEANQTVSRGTLGRRHWPWPLQTSLENNNFSELEGYVEIRAKTTYKTEQVVDEGFAFQMTFRFVCCMLLKLKKKRKQHPSRPQCMVNNNTPDAHHNFCGYLKILSLSAVQKILKVAHLKWSCLNRTAHKAAQTTSEICYSNVCSGSTCRKCGTVRY